MSLDHRFLAIESHYITPNVYGGEIYHIHRKMDSVAS